MFPSTIKVVGTKRKKINKFVNDAHPNDCGIEKINLNLSLSKLIFINYY